MNESDWVTNRSKIGPLLIVAALYMAFLAGCETSGPRETAKPVAPAVSLPEPPPPEPEPEPEPCPDSKVRKLVQQAIELLDHGESDRAGFLLDCAISQDSSSKRAKNLKAQLEVDPAEYLGSKYYWYTVKSDDTLSKIAHRIRGDQLEFVVLSRYNDIAVPANLKAGDRIKLPGSEPPPDVIEPPKPADVAEKPSEKLAPIASDKSASANHETALSMERQGDTAGAFALLTDAAKTDPSLPNIDGDLERVRRALIAKLEEQAYEDELAGNENEALENWRELLTVDPGNIAAQLAMQRLSK